MSVLIDNRQKRHRIERKKLQRTAAAILSALECPDGELSVVIVSDAEIAELNRTYFSREGPTNVIAFPMREGEFSNVSPDLLGDVVISADTAHREAEDADMPFADRFDQLLIHGILHLFGYDHETDDAERKEMEAKSEALFRMLKER